MTMGVRGQSLIEILVALAVLSGGLLGVAGAVLVSLRWTTEAAARTHAVVVLRNRIEALRQVTGSGAHGCDSVRSGGEVDSGGINQQWRVDSTEGGYLITVTASYASPGSSRTDTLATILGCR
jgi:prepilin-type N-terminal cleavage/methylation domain-containing protein